MSAESKHTDANWQELADRIERLEKELASEKEKNARISQNKNRVVNGIQMITDESTRILSGLVQASAEGVITTLNHCSRMADSQLRRTRGTGTGSSKAAEGEQAPSIFNLAVDVPRQSINKFFEVYQKK